MSSRRLDKSVLEDALSRVPANYVNTPNKNFDALGQALSILQSGNSKAKEEELRVLQALLEQCISKIVEVHQRQFSKSFFVAQNFLKSVDKTRETILRLQNDTAKLKETLMDRTQSISNLDMQASALRARTKLLDAIDDFIAVPSRVKDALSQDDIMSAADILTHSMRVLASDQFSHIHALDEVRSQLEAHKTALQHALTDSLIQTLFSGTAPIMPSDFAVGDQLDDGGGSQNANDREADHYLVSRYLSFLMNGGADADNTRMDGTSPHESARSPAPSNSPMGHLYAIAQLSVANSKNAGAQSRSLDRMTSLVKVATSIEALEILGCLPYVVVTIHRRVRSELKAVVEQCVSSLGEGHSGFDETLMNEWQVDVKNKQIWMLKMGGGLSTAVRDALGFGDLSSRSEQVAAELIGSLCVRFENVLCLCMWSLMVVHRIVNAKYLDRINTNDSMIEDAHGSRPWYALFPLSDVWNEMQSLLKVLLQDVLGQSATDDWMPVDVKPLDMNATVGQADLFLEPSALATLTMKDRRDRVKMFKFARTMPSRGVVDDTKKDEVNANMQYLRPSKMSIYLLPCIYGPLMRFVKKCELLTTSPDVMQHALTPSYDPEEVKTLSSEIEQTYTKALIRRLWSDGIVDVSVMNNYTMVDMETGREVAHEENGVLQWLWLAVHHVAWMVSPIDLMPDHSANIIDIIDGMLLTVQKNVGMQVSSLLPSNLTSSTILWRRVLEAYRSDPLFMDAIAKSLMTDTLKENILENSMAMTAGKSEKTGAQPSSPIATIPEGTSEALIKLIEKSALKCSMDGPSVLEMPIDAGGSDCIIPFSKRTIINDVERLKRIAVLCESCQWMSVSFLRLAESLTSVSDSYTRVEEMLTTCAKRAMESTQLLLVTLKLELRVQTLVYLSPLLKYRPNGLTGSSGVNPSVTQGSTLTSASEPDPCVRELTKNILEQDMVLSSVLPHSKMRFIMDQLTKLVSDVFMLALVPISMALETSVNPQSPSHVHMLSHITSQCYVNVFALQQALTRPYVPTDHHMDRVREYYGLLNLRSVDDLLSQIHDEGPKYTKDQYIVILKCLAPGMQAAVTSIEQLSMLFDDDDT